MTSPIRWLIRLVCVGLLGVEIAAAATGDRQLMYAMVLAIVTVAAVVWVAVSGAGEDR